MDIDAVLIVFSFVAFLALLVGWILAPRRADAPTCLPATVAAPQPPAAFAA
jgi:hypothetical protein